MTELHGGELVQLLAAPERRAELRAEARELPSWDLTERQIGDLELLIDGGFSPLSGFLDRRSFDSVCSSMRLPDGTLWPIPITLDVTEEVAAGLAAGSRLALRDRKGLYAKARAGLIAEFTGISDPYEEPVDPDLVLDTSELTPEESAQAVILHLEREGYIGPVEGSADA